MHLFDPKNLAKLDRQERKEMLDVKKILAMAGLQPGMTMADIGCGTGFFAFEAAEMVGDNGRIYAIDMQQPMLDELIKRIAEKGVKNILPVISEEYRLKIDDDTADLAFLAFVLHEVEYKQKFLSAVFDVIKPGGQIAILDWKNNEASKDPKAHDRISEYEATELLRHAGIKNIEIEEYNENIYMVAGVKPDHSIDE